MHKLFLFVPICFIWISFTSAQAQEEDNASSYGLGELKDADISPQICLYLFTNFRYNLYLTLFPR
jgi:hypothetical protein